MKGRLFFEQLLKDKDGNYNLRELVTLIFVLISIVSWIAVQFFAIPVPEYMFYSFISIIGAGCFGYSIERGSQLYNKSNPNQNEQQ